MSFALAWRAEERTVDRLPTDLSDDVDLDALMIRVREAAMASGTSGGAARPQTASDAKGADIDLARVIDAQGDSAG